MTQIYGIKTWKYGLFLLDSLLKYTYKKRTEEYKRYEVSVGERTSTFLVGGLACCYVTLGGLPTSQHYIWPRLSRCASKHTVAHSDHIALRKQSTIQEKLLMQWTTLLLIQKGIGNIRINIQWFVYQVDGIVNIRLATRSNSLSQLTDDVDDT